MEGPTDLTGTRSALSPAKRRLLEKWIGGGAPPQSSEPAIERRPQRGTVPLTFSQLRLWFLDQLAPGNPFYNIPVAVPLPADISPTVLRRCLNEIVRRHEALRTTFVSKNGEPAQIVADALDVDMPIIDARHVPPENRRFEAARIATEEARRPFDLTTGPLIRTALIDLGSEGYIQLLTIHHIVSDAWSAGVLFQEVTELYRAFAIGLSSPLPEPPLQYGDFAVWQRTHLSGAVLDSQLAYWKRQLKDLPVLDLPLDRPRPAVQSYRGGQTVLALPKLQTAALQSWSQQQGATLFMTLLAAFAALLGRYARQRDVVVGSPIAGRNRPELEKMVGFFVNHLVLRTDLAGDPSFRELVRRVRQVTLDAYAHQDLPFEKLVAELHPGRDLSRNPLFQVTFQIVNTPGVGTARAESEPLSIDVDQGTAIFDLAVNAWESPDGLRARFEYGTDLFDRASIERMAAHYQRLLERAVDHPDAPLSELTFLDVDEERKLTVEWNETDVTYPDNLCLHHMVEEQVRRSPAAPAVIADDETLTFDELNRKSDRVARQLAGRGVGPGSIVAIALNRSPGMVAALLGVLKAGACYLALDPAYPRSRLRFMVDDARAGVLITEPSVLDRLGWHDEGEVLFVEGDVDASDVRPLRGPATRDDVAYVLYTSGSTGTPKGALIHHAAICNHMLWMQQRFPLTSDDRVLQRTAVSFDASVWEFYAPLIAGATLVLAPPGAPNDGRALVDVIARQRVTILQLVPSLLKLLVEVPQFGACATLTRVFCGGEPLTADLVARFHARCAAELINLYGPTEATIDTHYFVCARGNGNGFVPIGKPIANTRSYVLDERLRPAPIGVPGELHIGGRAVGKGYLNRPDLTASRFVPDPFARDGEARLYKTGDLVRYLPDGNLHLLGRIDDQVKLRGFRIELGEVEAVLRQCEGVSDAVAIVREDPGREPRLVSYVVPRDGAFEGVSAVRGYVKERVPDYMVPSAVVVLERLPLTPNGKVDRGALPAPEGVRPESTVFAAPATAAEVALAGIWSAVLGVERVGVTDNFFELGGDSILSIQIVARARQAGWLVTPQQMFQQQTVRELAAVAVASGPDAGEEEGPVTGEVPLLPVQAWFFEQGFADAHHFNQAVLVPVGPGVPLAWLRTALTALVAQHDALRLRFAPTPAGWRGWCEAQVPVACEEVDLTALGGAAQRTALEAAVARVQASLDLTAGPVMRVALVRLGGGGADRLLWVVHHLAVDGVSWRILLDDLQTALGQQARGEPVRLPARTTSVRRWAERLQAYAATAGAAEVAYWQAQQGVEAPLPRDGEGGANTGAAEQTWVGTLSEAETRAVLQDVPALWHTQINDALLTALLEAWAGWTGGDRLRIDLEGHGREDLFAGVDVSRTVGWLTSIFPVWLRRETPGDLAATLRSVKEQLRRVPTRGLGYGVLRYLGPAEVRAALAGPPAAISVNYLGQLTPASAAPGTDEDADAWSVGPVRSPRAHRAYQLEINAAVLNGRLRVHWTYSTHLHTAATIAALGTAFLDGLRALIRLAHTTATPGYTPSDFPQARLDQKNLDKLFSRLNRARSRTDERPDKSPAD